MFAWEDAPRLPDCDVIDKMRSEIEMEEYLFYRTGMCEFDFLNGKDSPVWECQCTACGQVFLEEKRRKWPKSWTRCPRCGARITPRRWNDRRPLDEQQLSFYVFQRGEGREVWLRGYQVSRDRDGEFDVFEYSRAVFYDGGAQRWRRSRSFYSGVSDWQECREIILKLWHGCYGKTRENWFGRIDMDDIRGTVLEYSQLDSALSVLHDPVNYLWLYCRYPLLEMLWKMELGKLFYLREQGGGAMFRKCVNLRAKRPRDLLPGLDKNDLKMLQGLEVGFDTLEGLHIYQRLRRTLPGNLTLYQYAKAAAGARERVKERCTDGGGLLFRYFCRQQKRSGLRFRELLRDWGDYLDELEEIGGETAQCAVSRRPRQSRDAGKATETGQMHFPRAAEQLQLPDNLRQAHARLSARLRKKKTRGKNMQFRAQRHLLEPYRFARAGLLIRPIDSADEIIREGELQDNCVAGYAGRHAMGKTSIFVLRRREDPRTPFCTVEWNRAKNEVIQCRTKHNGTAPPEVDAFLDAWKKHNEEVNGR